MSRNNTFSQVLSNIQSELGKELESDLIKKTCKRCNLAINEAEYYGNADGHWHKEHYTCQKCNGDAGARGFFMLNRDIICERCVNVPKCATCQKDILGKCLADSSGAQYHEACFATKYTCDKCGAAITGKYITVNSRPWHIECYTCTVCRKSLNGVGAMQLRGRAYCMECSAHV